MQTGLAGRGVLVTGAASGIGLAIADRLAREGCRVWIADRDGEGAARAAAALRARDFDARALTVDVTRGADVADACAAIDASGTALDGLVCNAGVLSTGPFLGSDPDEARRVIEVNLIGAATCIRAAADIMARRGGGRIVNVASVSAMRGGGSIGNVLYGASKAGVVALTLGLARELGPLGIRVNAVAPAVADTPMTRASLGPDRIEEIAARIPLRRLATPADVADAAAFLLSDQAAFVTGAILPVDGGLLTT